MERSSGPAPSVRPTGRRAGGAEVFAYRRVPGLPPVGVLRFGGADGRTDEPPPEHAHAHEFLLLVYFERGGGGLRVDGRDWPVAAGDAFLIAPGEVVGTSAMGGLGAATAWAAFFPAEVLEPHGPASFVSWRSHPLLYPFVGRAAGGAQRLRVPADERAAWSERFAALDAELQARRDGYNEAVLAHLTLLLVGVSRLAADVVGDLRHRDEPLLAAVFERIEEGYAGRLSLRDVAGSVGLTPGHLTTVVGRKTGRTVQEWITERRMTEARRLLGTTDLTVEAIAERVGYRDAGYFIRTFRRRHAVTPLAWRRAV